VLFAIVPKAVLIEPSAFAIAVLIDPSAFVNTDDELIEIFNDSSAADNEVVTDVPTEVTASWVLFRRLSSDSLPRL
jgi:hypothetical protein